jgi:branched-chain amino acid transport system permease protein
VTGAARRHGLPVAATLAACAATSLLLPATGNEYWVSVGTNIAMWVALTESWIVLSGMTGYISLGHAAFVGIGSYAAVLLWGALPIWGALAVAGATAAALALLVGMPCFRVRGPYFVILTLGVSEFVKYIVINIEATLGNFGRLALGGPDVDNIFVLMCGLAGVAYLVAHFVRRSRFGMGLRAIREDEAAAETSAVPVTLLKVAAFMLSAIIPGMVGALTLMRSGYFEPLQVFNPVLSLTMITMAVIGGSDDAPGPLFGVLFLSILSEVLWNSAPQLYMIVLGVLLVAFVLRVPDGIYGRLLLARRRRRAV